MIVAGLGCRRGCPAADLVAAVQRAAGQSGLAVGALAAPAFKAHEPGLHQAALSLGIPLLLMDDAAMRAAQPRCPTRSAAALAATGLASVAEAAALAASGGVLLLPRLAVGSATCALAGPSGTLSEDAGRDREAPVAALDAAAANDPRPNPGRTDASRPCQPDPYPGGWAQR